MIVSSTDRVHGPIADGQPEDWPFKSGRKALAAFGAAAANDFLSASGQHALAEAMAALADKSAWLIRAFHDKFSV